MLTDEMIVHNKEEFIKILYNAVNNRAGANVDRLFSKLENSDFFVAPASTRFHNSFKGGLVAHCLNVYYNMMNLASIKHLITVYNRIPEEKDEEGNIISEERFELVEGSISPESIAIVSLLHDFSKMNYYRIDYRNKKVYCESGSKKDENGRFDWVSVPSYVTIPAEERFVYGSHEETAEFMVRQFIPLSWEESTAILHHHFSLGFDSIKDVGVVSNVYDRCPLATLLHCADTMATYIDEKGN